MDAFSQTLEAKADILFRHMDKQNNGFISDVDIMNWIKEVSDQGIQMGQVKRAVQKWDLPDPDTITKEVFISFFVTMMQKKIKRVSYE